MLRSFRSISEQQDVISDMQRRFERDRNLLQEENKKLQTETEKVSNLQWQVSRAWNVSISECSRRSITIVLFISNLAYLKTISSVILSSLVILQLSEKLGKVLASQRRNDEELKDMREKNDQVAHWEGQIGEIIKWYVRVGFDYEGILRKIFAISYCLYL